MSRPVCLVLLACLAFLATNSAAAPLDSSSPALRSDTELPLFADPDTVCFGGHDGEGYAVEGGTWGFDDGTLQGWYGIDQSIPASGDPWWKRVAALDFECSETAPMIKGTEGQLWMGRQQSNADTECWICDAGLTCSLGYINDLVERIESPTIPYGGGDVNLEFDYFCDSEVNLDGTLIKIISLDDTEVLAVNTLDFIAGQVGDPQNPAHFSGVLSGSEPPPGTDGVRIRFEFEADGGWSDMDGMYCSTYGPFGIDDVEVRVDDSQVAFYDFDVDAQGWVAMHGPGAGDEVGATHLSEYELGLDPEDCGFEGYLLEFHDEGFTHPHGQKNLAVSPIIDRSAYPPETYNQLLIRGGVYTESLSDDVDVLYGVGWYYYPWVCEASGEIGWSPRVGPLGHYLVGDGPSCFDLSEIMDPLLDVPLDAEMYRLAIEVLSYCPLGSSCPPDFSPLFDNIQVCLIGEQGPSQAPEVGGEILTGGSTLYQNEPNPFNPRTIIRFSVATASDVELIVYDVSGRLVRRLVNEPMDAGHHEIPWDGLDEGGRPVPSGPYWTQLRVGEDVFSKQMILLR